MHKEYNLYSTSVLVLPRVKYSYKYRIAQANQQIDVEKGLRNFLYQEKKQTIDIWNKKEIILRIYSEQSAIIKGLEIKVSQKCPGQNDPVLHVKKMEENNSIFYEGSFKADISTTSLVIRFTFNSQQQFQTLRNQQKFSKELQFQYSKLKVFGNKSLIEISEQQFHQLSCQTQSNNNIQKQMTNYYEDILTPFELQNVNVKKLQQIYESSIKQLLENLKQKDLQISKLQLHALQQDDLIIFDSLDQFTQQMKFDKKTQQFKEIIDELEFTINQFKNIIKDLASKNIDYEDRIKNLQDSQKKDKEDLQFEENVIKELKEKCSDCKITIDKLNKKIKELKSQNSEQNSKIIQLEKDLEKLRKSLEKKMNIIYQLETRLIELKDQNGILKQKTENFKKQITSLDENLEKLQQQNIRLQREFNQQSFQLTNFEVQLENKQTELHQFQVKYNQHSNQIKNAKQMADTIQKYSDEQENQIVSATSNLLKLFEANLNKIEDILIHHNEPEIKQDTQNLIFQITQFNNDLMTPKLNQVIDIFQNKFQIQLSCLCDSQRIKEDERLRFNHYQNCIKIIIDQLFIFKKLKEHKPTLQTQISWLQHQPSIPNQQKSPKKKFLKRSHSSDFLFQKL